MSKQTIDPALQAPSEQRLCARWTTPSLLVHIGERAHYCANWSLGGLLVEDVDDRGWRCGETVELEVGLHRGALHADTLIVVRYNPTFRRLALRTRRAASVLLDIHRQCVDAGIPPE